MMTIGTQILIIGIVLYMFGVKDIIKALNDPMKFAVDDKIRLKYQMFTANFFVIGSFFLT